MDDMVSIEMILDRVNADDGIKKLFCRYKECVDQLNIAYKDSYDVDVKELDDAERDDYHQLEGFFEGLCTAGAITPVELSFCLGELYDLHFI